jgi:pilus assembly protein Flp/PilA
MGFDTGWILYQLSLFIWMWELAMKNFIKSFVTDESGASAAEYALILAVVGAGIGGAAYLLGGAIKTSIDGSATAITNCTAVGGVTPTGCK